MGADIGADIGATGTVDGTLDSMLGILGTLGVGAAPGTSRSNRSVCSGRSWDINTSCGFATTIDFQHNWLLSFGQSFGYHHSRKRRQSHLPCKQVDDAETLPTLTLRGICLSQTPAKGYFLVAEKLQGPALSPGPKPMAFQKNSVKSS